MTSSHHDTPPCQWFSRLASALDRRSAPRLALLFLGAVLARGRRTVTSWIRAAGLSGEFRPCYTTVAAAGKKADDVAARLVLEAVKPLVAEPERLTLALDDTPTQRYGPHVQGAGIHHNPTPGPAGSPYVYGHVWVVLGLLATHPAWGVIALPLLARLYVRKKDLPGIDPKHRPEFRTKLELAVELLRWASAWLGLPGQAALGGGRRGVCQGPVPQAGDGAGDDGRQPAAQGRGAVDRARSRGRRAARPAADLRGAPHRRWPSGPASAAVGRPACSTCTASRRSSGTRRSWRPGGRPAGAIRVVLVDEPTGWVAFFCTDTSASVAEILRDGGRPVRAGDRLPRLQGGRRGGPAAGAVRVGEHRCVPRVPVDVHDDRGVGVGPVGGGVGGPIGRRRGTTRTAARATRTSVGRGVGSCWREEIRAVLHPGVTEAEIQAAAERLLSLAA